MAVEAAREAVTSRILTGDALTVLRTLDDKSIHCCITSPPYWGLRDYGVEGQIGLEPTPEEFVAKLVDVFREVRRVLRDDGTLWLNIGDSYVGSPGGSQGKTGQRASRTFTARIDLTKRAGSLSPKNLVGIPWRLAFALQADGWILRSEIIWQKMNPMPESTKDRPTKSHEQVFLLAKSARYFYDAEAVEEKATGRAPGNKTHRGSEEYSRGDEHHRTKAGLTAIGARETRNLRDVWTIPSQPFAGAHFATMPIGLVEPCILAGCPIGGVVLDPFAGAGTVGLVASRRGRSFVGIELNPKYAAMARHRIVSDAPLLNEVSS